MSVDRRGFIAGAAAAGVTVPGVAGAGTTRPIGRTREARNNFEVIGTIVQEGLTLTGFGWLTHVAGLRDDDLFTDPDNRSASTARLRWHSVVQVAARDFLPNLFSATGNWSLRIFFDADGGAQPGDEATFTAGRRIARYAVRFHTVLTITGPDQAATQLTGELTQREARVARIGGGDRRLGRRGLRQRLVASGPGARSEPNIPRATFHVAGGVVTPD
jgi:hypothetical protein